MTFSVKARKAVASVLAVSTVMWAAALTVAPVSAAAHGEGCLVNVSGTVYLITGGQKRGFTSAEVFMSHGYNFGQVIAANSDDASLPTGPIQIYANGTLVKGPVDPLVYLVVNGQKRGFTSGAVFTGLGYSFANIQWAPVNTFNDIPTGSNINSTSETGLPMSGPGPKTVNCSGTTPDDGGSTGDCDLDGNAGDITVTEDTTVSTEEVGESEEEVDVLGFEVEADDDSDVALTSVRVAFWQSDTNVSQDLDDYVSEVQIMHEGNVVGTADPEDFNEASDVYTKSISLDCAEVMAGETGEFTVAVTAQDNLDSADIATENWRVDLWSVRFEDADGVTTTETIDDSDISTLDAGAIDQLPDFVDFSTAADVELQVALNQDEDAVNEAHNVIVEDDEDTDDEPVLAFTLEAEGDSDILVNDIPVLLTSSDSDIATVLSSADLYHGTSLVGSETVDAGATTDTVTFDDLDINIDAGDTEEFWVKVNIGELENNYLQGATVQAQVTVASIDSDDEEGDELTGSELTGSAIGEALSLFSNGITVDVVSAETEITATDTALGDVAEFQWELEITNVGDDVVYVNADNADVVSSSASSDVDQVYVLVQSGSNALTALSGTVDSDEDAETADTSAYVGAYGAGSETFFRIDSGESITVNIVVSGTNGTAAGQVRAYLSGIEWTTDDITCATACDATAATINTYSANLDEDSETPFRPVN